VLPTGSVGVDHNAHSIEYVRSLGHTGFTTAEFEKSKPYKPKTFDTLLLSHVLEHMDTSKGIALIKSYSPLVKDGGKIIIFCPQEKGYASDNTHVIFQDNDSLEKIIKQAGFTLIHAYSFPFPRGTGKWFKYNEFVVVGQKSVR